MVSNKLFANAIRVYNTNTLASNMAWRRLRHAIRLVCLYQMDMTQPEFQGFCVEDESNRAYWLMLKAGIYDDPRCFPVSRVRNDTY